MHNTNLHICWAVAVAAEAQAGSSVAMVHSQTGSGTHDSTDGRCFLLQAAILTGRRSKTATSMVEVDDSVDRIVAGMEGTPMVDSKSKSLVAYHEVGHAVCGTLTPGRWQTCQFPPIFFLATQYSC